MNLFKLKIVDFNSEQVNIGDVYIFHYAIRKSVIPGIDLLRQKFTEYVLERKDRFEVERVWEENNELLLQVKCIRNPLPFLVVFSLIVAGSATIMYVFGIELNKVEKIITLPEGKILLAISVLIAVVFAYKTIFK